MSEVKKVSTKLTVQETLAKLKEKNPSPRRIYNKSELTLLVQALLSDPDYVAKNTKIKGGKFITEDRHIIGEFRKSLIDLVKQLGLNAKEAEAAIANYKVPKSMASAVIDAVNHGSFLYMKEIGKGVSFIGESDVIQTAFFRPTGQKSHRIPQRKDGKPLTHTKVGVAEHSRMSWKSRVNPDLKTLLK